MTDDLIKRLRRTPLYDGAGESADELADAVADALEASQAPVNTRRAPHMEHHVKITPFGAMDNPNAMQVRLQIGVQSFLISDGADHCHESTEAAEWCRDMLCNALATLRNDVIEECAQQQDAEGLAYSASMIRALKTTDGGAS